MTPPEPPFTRVEWGFVLWWVLATTVGWLVGFAICEAFKAFLESITADGAVIGVSVGIAQWLVLRGRIGRAGWWILATIVGFAIGKYVGGVIAENVPGAVGLGLSGAAIGVSVGVTQWLVLRRHVIRAEWWILASVLAWTVGGGIIGAADEMEGGSAYLIGAAGAVIAGAITGASLAWLLRTRTDQPAPSAAG
jgi:hypothetical protein